MHAIILAGGRGTRLEPWSAPKCLMPINGVTILQRLLAHFDDSGWIQHAVVCTGYRAKDVDAALRYYNARDFSMDVSDAGEHASMGERLLKARTLTDGGRVLICYGDELANVDVKQLLKEHEGRVLTVTKSQQAVPGGSVHEDEDGVCIVEDEYRWVNIGFVVVEPICWLQLLPTDGVSDWINRVSRRHGTKVGVFEHTGKRATVNSLADLKHAEEVWR